LFVNIPLDYADVFGGGHCVGGTRKKVIPLLSVENCKSKCGILYRIYLSFIIFFFLINLIQQTEAPSPSDCSIDSTSGMGGVGGIGSVGSNASLGLASGSSGQVGVAAGVCAACGELITDRFLIQVSGRTWHSTCLRCSVCRTALDNQPSCFVRAGAIYCRADYTRYMSTTIIIIQTDQKLTQTITKQIRLFKSSNIPACYFFFGWG
jgi:hypothetical protein